MRDMDHADVLEHLVQQTWLDIGAPYIYSRSPTKRGDAMTPLAYVVLSFSRDPSRSAVLRRMASALVRASVARRDDGSGINEFLPHSQMSLVHLAVTTGDLELTQILLSHPLCKPRRVCRSSAVTVGRHGEGRGTVNAAELAARLGFARIQHAIENSPTFSVRT